MGIIHYHLNKGVWAPKDELKEQFYTDLYYFINERFDTKLKQMPLQEFIVSEPYIIGNLLGKYFLKEEIGGRVENQPIDYFIGYCYQNQKYLELIPHLEKFFALWREIERCSEAHATDFYANSWASLVDTAKFFKYSSKEELANSPEAPQVQDELILNMFKTCPEVSLPILEVELEENIHLARPIKKGYRFLGWFDTPNFEGKEYKNLAVKKNEHYDMYAKWETYTIFHSNDGYTTFDELYQDFLHDFSNHIGIQVGMNAERVLPHGPISDFCKFSYGGRLNSFFQNQKYYDKWFWLTNYLKEANQGNEDVQKRFEFINGEFGLEAQVRWELNSLFLKRFHLVWPKTKDYGGAGIKEKLADVTNSRIMKINYPVGEVVKFPLFYLEGYHFDGWYCDPKALGDKVEQITDEKYAAKILYAKWNKIK